MKPSPGASRTVVIGIACLAFGACGAPSAKRIDAAFRARADLVCASALRIRARHPFPLPNFNPTDHPTKSQLMTVADYFSAYGTAASTYAALARLGVPAKGAETWRSLLALLAQDKANAAAQINVARSGDVKGFVASVHAGERMHARIVNAGRAAGFADSSACARYVG